MSRIPCADSVSSDIKTVDGDGTYVEDSLAVGGDDVAALGQTWSSSQLLFFFEWTERGGDGLTPCDWVQAPQEDGPDTADDIGAVDVSTERLGVGTTLEDHRVGDEQERDAAEGEETPLVTRFDERADETSDDHDLVHQDHVHDGWARHAAGEEQVSEQQRCCDEPIDVADVEDLAHEARDLRVGASEFDLDGGPAEVGAHTEVGDRCDEGDGSSQVVEEALRAVLARSQAHEGEGRHAHNGADGEVEAAAGGGDMIVGHHRVGEAVDVDRIIAHLSGSQMDGGEAWSWVCVAGRGVWLLVLLDDSAAGLT